MKTIDSLVTSHPFFKGFSPESISRLEEHAFFEYHDRQREIFENDADADKLYLICHGKVSLTTPFTAGQGRMEIQTLGAGEILGWSWFFPPYRWHFTALAVEPTKLIAFNAWNIRHLANENHDFGFELATRIGALMLERLQATRLKLLADADRKYG